MIDNDILERVLAEGLRTGADFAEVFPLIGEEPESAWMTERLSSCQRVATVVPAFA